jgi:hypothetical protein
LVKYIAQILGVRTYIKGDKVKIEIPELNTPKNIIVTPVGSTNTDFPYDMK